MNFFSNFKLSSNSNEKQVVVRFAPSPTGFIHLGSARTALFNYFFVKQNNGKFMLRIEDTDKERSKKEYEEDIIKGLEWLNIKYDGKIYRQSERIDIYKKYIKKMIDNGSAYEAEENKIGTGKIIRFKNPNKKIKFNDLIRGEIEFDTTELKDFVIAKDLDTPLYHLAVVVDDFDMGVTHIIRGDDGISNTPRQILIQRSISAPEPIYAHIPLILASDKSKLSKRHGAVSVNEYEKMGYLPMAIINFLALIGWHPEDDNEIFSMEELIKEFDIERVQKSGAIFNQEKLDWINREYIKKLPNDIFLEKTKKYLSEIPDNMLEKIIPIIAQRINKFGDIKDMNDRGEFSYFSKTPKYEKQKFIWKNSNKEDTKTNIDEIVRLLQNIDFTNIDTIKNAVWNYAEEMGRGAVLWPMRYALSGLDKSPDPFTLAFVLGKEETILRLKNASKILIN